jgi:CRP/FNR family transcriptional regulator, cyclic AMP receptor protein
MALGANAKIALLRTAPLFAQCSKRELQQIARIADEIDLPAGKVLIREGERGTEFFVLVEGEVEVRRKGRKVKDLGPGSFVGEIALLSKIPRVATVTAQTPLHVLVITDRAFLALLEKVPSLAVKVARTLAERVGENELADLRAGKA